MILDRISIRARLVAATLAIIGTVIATGWLQWAGTEERRAGRDALRRMNDADVKAVSDAYGIVIAEAAQKTRDAVLSPAEAIAVIAAARSDANVGAGAAWARLVAEPADPTEAALRDETRVLIDEANASVDALVGHLDNADLEQVDGHVKGDLYGRLEGLTKKLEALAAHRRAEAIARAAAIEARHESVRAGLVGALGIGVLLAVILIASVIVGVGRGERRITTFLSALSSGGADLGQRVAVPGDDELARIGAAVNDHLRFFGDAVRELKAAGGRVTLSATVLAEAGRSLEATIGAQSQQAHDAAAMTRRMAESTGGLSEALGTASDLSRAASQDATDGELALGKLADGLGRLESATSPVGEKLDALNEQIGEMDVVVATVGELAERAGLVAMNAAIAVERGGGNGAGAHWTGVTEEIRRLAERASGATAQLERLVEETQTAVAAGVTGAEMLIADVKTAAGEASEVRNRIGRSIERCRELHPHLETATASLAGQRGGSDVLERALEQLDESSSAIGDSLSRTKSAATELDEVVGTLRERMAQLQVEGASTS